ncbi:MAG: A/G-specific adenine glycosylase [Bacteroidales bacterium]|nr:A/G-specific adenine glycosylase [Bacteroidales bacterium]
MVAFADTLISWYEDHKRDLPWRGEPDPYKIWVSEIILQQTRVQQGWDYYLRFIDNFPDVKALAEADEDRVLKVWQGLGYYSRARNMHAAAREIMEKHGGHFPNEYDKILSLKGIGNYTAAAISSIAFGLPYPAVDGNVIRIVSRIFGICDDVTQPVVVKKITAICEMEIDNERPGVFNQAAMDFGAIQCVPRNPDCDECPFQSSCYAYNNHLVDILPVKKKKAESKHRYFHYTVYLSDNQTIIEKRTGSDIWRNMYQFPLTETDSEEYADKPLFSIREVLSHQIIHAAFYVKTVKKLPKLSQNQLVIPFDDMEKYPMPKIMTEFLKYLA